MTKLEQELEDAAQNHYDCYCESSNVIASFLDGVKWERERSKKLVEALKFYANYEVNYYMRNNSFDENGKLDGFVNWTDRDVDRGELAKKILEEYGGVE